MAQNLTNKPIAQMENYQQNPVNEWNDQESPLVREIGDLWHTVVPKPSESSLPRPLESSSSRPETGAPQGMQWSPG
ncbi:hypothetical protein HQ447_00770 [bacterium]|nr:hypothetical protein [bacterium]